MPINKKAFLTLLVLAFLDDYNKPSKLYFEWIELMEIFRGESVTNNIKGPIFITKHVNQSVLSNNGYLAVTRQGGTFIGKSSISLISYEMYHEVINITNPSSIVDYAPFRIVGSCNGVLCLNASEVRDKFFI